MRDKQFFAQLGALALLGLNVAAYFVFWPAGGWSSQEAPVCNSAKCSSCDGEERKGCKRGSECKGDPPTAPSASPAIPDMPPANSNSNSSEQGPDVPPPAAELLPKFPEPATFLKETPPGTPTTGPVITIPGPMPVSSPAEPLPPLPPLPWGTAPGLPGTPPVQPTEALQPSPVGDPGPLPLPGDSSLNIPIRNPAPAAAPVTPAAPVAPIAPAVPTSVSNRPAPRAMESPWLLNMEMVGTQTQLIALLRPRSAGHLVAEFKILCDRIEMKAPDGTLQAVGKVTFTGAGLRGSCQRLTVPLAEMRILFEENVELANESAAPGSLTQDRKEGPVRVGTIRSLLRGDRIIWELPATAFSAATGESGVQQVNFEPQTPTVVLPAERPMQPAILEGPR